MPTLSISQLRKDSAATRQICKINIPPGEWERITKRVLPTVENDAPMDCWLELYEGEDLVSDSPFVVRPHHAVWLLHDFFKQPRSIVSKVRANPVVQPIGAQTAPTADAH